MVMDKFPNLQHTKNLDCFGIFIYSNEAQREKEKEKEKKKGSRFFPMKQTYMKRYIPGHISVVTKD